MKNYGRVVKYGGISGTIKGNDGKDYLLLDKNIVSKDVNIEPYDDVEFESDYHKTCEIEVNIARFVKVLKKNK